VDDEGAVEVHLVVNPIWNLLTLGVGVATGWSVSVYVYVDVHVDDLVRGEEAILNALLQRVGVDRLTEVVNVGNVLRLLRRCGQTNLRGAREVVEDLAPRRIVSGTASMTLIDYDQVEEVRREVTEDLLALLRAGDRLIEAEIDLVGRVDPTFPVE